MYSEIEINTLSKNQISKLLNGHPVRLMAGKGHTLGVSNEQFKKLIKASEKSPPSAVTITLDPYQIDQSQHLRNEVVGSGMKTGMKKKSKVSITPTINKSKQIALKRLNDQVKRDMMIQFNEEQPYQEYEEDIEGEGFKDFVGMMKRKKVGKKIVNVGKKIIKNPIVKKVGEALLERGLKTIAGGQVKKPRAKRVVKRVVKKSITASKKGGALFPAGM